MKKISLFSDKQFYRDLFALAIPIMLQNSMTSFVNMLDTFMVGRLGTAEIAAVGLGNQVFFLINLTLFGICSGSAIFTAQFWGKKDIPGIRKNLGLCLILTITASLIFSLASAMIPEKIIGIYSKDEAVIKSGAAYLRIISVSFIPYAITMAFTFCLRSVEKMRLCIVATAIAITINGSLNYLLIFGVGPFPAMGVEGAALATVIARVVEMLIIVSATYILKYIPAGKITELFAFDRFYAKQFLKVTIPVILQEMLWSTGITSQSVIFARTSTDAIAAFNITNTVSMLFWVLFLGIGNGVGVLIGKKIGEGNESIARDYASKIVRLAPLMAAGAAMLLFPISFLLPFIFNISAEALAVASHFFIIMCIAYPFRAFNLCMIVGICRAGGDTVFCALYDTIILWCFSLPLAALAAFVFNAPVWLIYCCLFTEEPIKLFLGAWRLKSGKWLHNVTVGL